METQIQLLINYIGNIKEFDGNDPSQLPDFISQIDNLMIPYNALSAEHKIIMFGYIKNKCVGEARKALHDSDGPSTWVEIKKILKENFGEKKTITELTDELLQSRLLGTIEQLYNRIQKITTRMHNRRLTQGDTHFTSDDIKRLSLNVFKELLPEPTKTLIFARNPHTLKDAYQIIQEARHQYYTGNRTSTNRYNYNTRRNSNYNYNQPTNNRQEYNPSRQTFKSDSNQTKRNYNYNQPTNNRHEYNPSGNTRQTFRSNANQFRSNNNSNWSGNTRTTHRSNRVINDRSSSVEPMEIGHNETNFQSDEIRNYPT